jgi:hypothetical protein
MQQPTAPVSSFAGCDGTRQTPIWIKRRAILLVPFALAAMPPRKNFGAVMRPWGSHNCVGCRVVGANPQLARIPGDPLLLHIGDGGTASHSISVAVRQSTIRACRSPSKLLCEAARHIEWFVLLQHMEACAGELVRQGLARQDRIGLAFLSLVETFGLGAIAQRKIGRLDERPGSR